MIKNERQYRLTKSQAQKFSEALEKLESAPEVELGSLMQRIQTDAVRSMYQDLCAEIKEYEDLQSARPAIIDAASLEELPNALIRARIALGMSQRDLAEKMGLKEQQVQRYEATDYASASLGRLTEVADALGVRVAEQIMLPLNEPSPDALLSRLDSIGIDSDFLFTRLLPSEARSHFESGDSVRVGRSIASVSDVLNRIYGWSSEQLFSTSPLGLSGEATATARFKIPGGAHGRRLNAYIVYAHYVGMVVAKACKDFPLSTLTQDPSIMRADLFQKNAEITLRSVLHHFWDKGVPVVPLGDSGAFHGASWRVEGRNVIVVKQKSKYLSRWIFDLLHEWHHASQDPEETSHSWIEDSEITSTRRVSPEEQAANRFAGDVVTDGRAEELVKLCVKEAKGKIPLLKSVVPIIAKRAGVSVEHLANYLAWRLSLQNDNWWGAANNLQSQIGDPHAIARDVFYERFDFSKINPVDARILSNALAIEGEA